MGKLVDIVGRRFGRLLVIERAGSWISEGGSKRALWLCRCDCGSEVKITGNSLLSGKSNSCGCYRQQEIGDRTRTHGMRRSRVYRCWCNMIQRCTNPKNPLFERYSQFGIDQSFLQFDAFYAHIGDPPKPRMSIDRIDNTKGYFPGNVKWATQTEQCRNKSTNRLVIFQGASKTVAEWACILGVRSNALISRLDRGWSDHLTISVPVAPSTRKRVSPPIPE